MRPQGLGKSTTSTTIETVEYLEDAVLMIGCSGANAEKINDALEKDLEAGVNLVMQQLRMMHGFAADDSSSAPAPPSGECAQHFILNTMSHAHKLTQHALRAKLAKTTSTLTTRRLGSTAGPRAQTPKISRAQLRDALSPGSTYVATRCHLR